MKEIASLGAACYKTIELLVCIIILLTWILGFMLAQGAWSKLFCIFPPYSFVVVAEKVIAHFDNLSWLLK